MNVDIESFKDSMRRWATGVTVVTAVGAEGDEGMTVSAFSSVSLEPPLVVVCLHAPTRTHAAVEDSGRFAVNVLSSEQEELSSRFASFKGERFEGVAVSRGVTGAALLEGAIARLECEVASAHREGTHTLFVGRVVSAVTASGEPLLYAAGGYRRLAP